MKDVVVLAGLLVSFATLVATHAAIVGRLLWSARSWYRGLVAVAVPPMGLWWAWQNRWRRSCLIWLGSVVGYACFRVLAVAL